ncbi:predicted protein, partial [Nematostella vectensis]
VHLNIGGKHFTVSRRTLMEDSSTLFHALLSNPKIKPQADGCYFINRDPKHFRYILNFIRTGIANLPEDAKSLNEILLEARFYQLQGLLEHLTQPFMFAHPPRLQNRLFHF